MPFARVSTKCSINQILSHNIQHTTWHTHATQCNTQHNSTQHATHITYIVCVVVLRNNTIIAMLIVILCRVSHSPIQFSLTSAILTMYNSLSNWQDRYNIIKYEFYLSHIHARTHVLAYVLLACSYTNNFNP